MESYISRWSAPGYKPHHLGPLWILWKLGLAPTKRQADFLLMFIIVASSTWSYLIITGYTDEYQEAFHVFPTEVYGQ